LIVSESPPSDGSPESKTAMRDSVRPPIRLTS
jgi:hypothetical protein